MAEQLDKRAIFKDRFATVMTEMGKTAHKDPETIYLIGSLAGHLIDRAHVSDWTQLKSNLSQDAYGGLLDSFRIQGNEHHQKGNKKAAFAIEVLAISVICMTMRDDEHVAQGEDLLDRMIADTIAFFRRQSGKQNTAPKPN